MAGLEAGPGLGRQPKGTGPGQGCHGQRGWRCLTLTMKGPKRRWGGQRAMLPPMGEILPIKLCGTAKGKVSLCSVPF